MWFINHMEADHSGSLTLLRKYYPNVKVVGNKKTFARQPGFMA
jgi:flavorubredoxin